MMNVGIHFNLCFQSEVSYQLIEAEAIKLANEIGAEFWALSSLTGQFIMCYY